MGGKRLKLARIFLRAGFRESMLGGKPASLLVVNYHRLWPNPVDRASEFDDGVFGPDAVVFRKQLEWLRCATTVLDEQGLLELAAGGLSRHSGIYSAITFDDAYIDCFSIASPILAELGLRGIFFVPVKMIDSRCLGWWDLAAYILKKCKKTSVSIGDDVLKLGDGLAPSLRHVLNLFKHRPADETDSLLEQLSQACGVPLPSDEAQSAELMSWKQLRAMRAMGHGIGSHTFSHRVLATLPPPEQAREIGDSRGDLAARIHGEVMSFAYPVGGVRHIDSNSVACVREAGYQLAFTFNTGMARLPLGDRFQIPRESADTVEILQAKALMPGLMGVREKRAV